MHPFVSDVSMFYDDEGRSSGDWHTFFGDVHPLSSDWHPFPDTTPRCWFVNL